MPPTRNKTMRKGKGRALLLGTSFAILSGLLASCSTYDETASDSPDATRPAVGTAIGSVEPAATVANPALPPISDPAQLSPPPYNRFIRPDTGRLETYVWDDRPISAAQKLGQPWYDSRWKPFSGCLVAEGYEVRANPTRPFDQNDLDEVLARANAQLTNSEANKRIGSNVASVPGIAGAFLRCAGRWLALAPEEYGIARLEPGEVPAP